MRYKIVFELPFIDQKNLQNAHSHFAFAGWVTQAIMFLILEIFRKDLLPERLKFYYRIFFFNCIICYALIFSFLINGYGVYSIVVSTLQMITTLYFFFKSIADIKKLKTEILNWIAASYLFYIISVCGTFNLAWMAITKSMVQDQYLASIYWYLHFQYNGWFFFSCVGILLNYLHEKHGLTVPNIFFRILFVSCLLTYGLSVLWLDLHSFVYFIIVVGAILQTIGFFGMMNKLSIRKWLKQSNSHVSIFILFLLSALTVKILLQLFSVIPAISKWAFGYRPVVIAYLHLILLAIISVFLILFILRKQDLLLYRKVRIALLVFLSFIVLNEVILAMQGILSFGYVLIPLVNEALLAISLGILGSAIYMWRLSDRMMKVQP